MRHVGWTLALFAMLAASFEASVISRAQAAPLEQVQQCVPALFTAQQVAALKKAIATSLPHAPVLHNAQTTLLVARIPNSTRGVADGVFVYLRSTYFCGTGGCMALVFKENQINSIFSYKPAGQLTLITLPVVALKSAHHGWQDIGVHTLVGTARLGLVKLTYNGHTYPSNPSVVPNALITAQDDVTDTLVSQDPANKNTCQLL